MHSAIVDVAIGLALVYFLMALFVTTVQEALAALLNQRGKTLRDGMLHMLQGGADVAQALLAHPLVRTQARKKREPSYLPAPLFSAALLDVLGNAGRWTVPPLARVEQLPDGALKASLRPIAARAAGDWAEFERQLQGWFDATMERVSGWYKLRVRYWLLGIAAVLAIGLNIDSFAIAKALSIDPILRAEVVARAEVLQRTGARAGDTNDVKARLDEIDKLREARLPIGLAAAVAEWNEQADGWARAGFVLVKLLGCLLSALAASLGAPLWFDLMNSLLRLRSGAAVTAAAAGTAPLTSAAPERAAAAAARFESGLTRADILGLQQALGLPNAQCSGVVDGATRAALRQWQGSHGWPADGVLTADLFARILVD
jgi:hypothetical protein